MHKDLTTLIEEGESNRLVFFQDVDNPIEIAKSICALANSQGGSLLIGVKKNSKIIGIEPSESYSIISQICENYFLSPQPFVFDVHHFSFKVVGEVYIEKTPFLCELVDITKQKMAYLFLGQKVVKANVVLKKFIALEKKKSPVLFSETMSNLLAEISHHNYSYTQLAKVSTLKRNDLENSLADLLYLKKIDVELINDTFYFRKSK